MRELVPRVDLDCVVALRWVIVVDNATYVRKTRGSAIVCISGGERNGV
jgi:hypothetical protein